MTYCFLWVTIYNSPWDRGQIGIKLGTKHVIYQKLDYNEKGGMKLSFEGLETEMKYINR